MTDADRESSDLLAYKLPTALAALDWWERDRVSLRRELRREFEDKVRRTTPFAQRRNGDPIWLIAGAALDGDGDGDGDGGQGDRDDRDGDGGGGGQGRTGSDRSKGGKQGGKDDDGPAIAPWFKDLPDDAKRYIRDLRGTAQGHSAKAQAAQRKLDEIEQAAMTAEQKLQAEAAKLRERNAELEERDRRRSTKDAFERAGRNAGAKKPERIWRLIDPDQIRYDDITGDVTNADELVTRLVESDGYLFEPRKPAGGADAGAKRAARAGADQNRVMNDFIRQSSGRT